MVGATFRTARAAQISAMGDPAGPGYHDRLWNHHFHAGVSDRDVRANQRARHERHVEAIVEWLTECAEASAALGAYASGCALLEGMAHHAADFPLVWGSPPDVLRASVSRILRAGCDPFQRDACVVFLPAVAFLAIVGDHRASDAARGYFAQTEACDTERGVRAFAAAAAVAGELRRDYLAAVGAEWAEAHAAEVARAEAIPAEVWSVWWTRCAHRVAEAIAAAEGAE